MLPVVAPVARAFSPYEPMTHATHRGDLISEAGVDQFIGGQENITVPTETVEKKRDNAKKKKF